MLNPYFSKCDECFGDGENDHREDCFKCDGWGVIPTPEGNFLLDFLDNFYERRAKPCN